MSNGISEIKNAPCMWMRGGTSKGGFFEKSDLPQNIAQRDSFLLSIMGSPDLRQIDGMGGGDPLTSKVAVVSKSERPGVDIDYLFLQVSVDKLLVSDAQNCGNLLAAVGPFALERGLVPIKDEETQIAIYMENTGQTAIATIDTKNARVNYIGSANIDGVPGTAAPVELEFQDTAGSSCGALLPTGNLNDKIAGTSVTMIDNGMPCVILKAQDMGISGSETRQELEDNHSLREKLEAIRLQAGHKMNLGDVAEKTVPKMTMVSAAINGGTINTRTFIPHRCHASIGVLGAVSVAGACVMEGTIAHDLANPSTGKIRTMAIEHPIGQTTIIARLNEDKTIASTAILRTARKLFDGIVYA